MKKKLISLIVITIIIISFVFIKAVSVQQSSKTIWQTSGYILNSQINEYSSDNVEKYYFNADTEYKLKYDKTLSFKNTDEKEVITDSNIFVHYSDDSISSFSKGVILNLDDIENDPILYYNFSEKSVIQKSKNNYSIYTINGEVKLTDFVYKISNNKYIIVSNEFEIEFSDGTKRKVSNYLEFEYMDNEIIKLYNDSFFYQTVDTNLKLNLRKNIIVDLEAKVISKDGSKKLTLDNMVINSNDNINSIDLDEYKDLNELAEEERLALEAEEKARELEAEEKEKKEKAEQTKTQPQTQTINDSTYTQNNSTTIVGGQVTSGAIATGEGSEVINGNDVLDENIEKSEEISQDNNDGNESYNEEIVEEDLSVNMPKFNVTKFENDAVSVNVTVEVIDEEGLLSSEYLVNIYKNSTGKSIFSTSEVAGTYSFNLDVATLEPDTYYTLSVNAGYTVDDIQYSKVFIYKIFKTDTLGLEFSKNYFTDTTMDFNVSIDEKSKIQNAVLQIVDSNGEVINSQIIDKSTTNVNFSGLKNNTNYSVRVTNIYYDNQVIENGFSISKDYSTLKAKPSLGKVDYTINKKESTFVLSLNGTQDPDNSINSYRYEIYNLQGTTPIYVSELEKNENVIVKVDDILIYRNSEYYFKVIATVYDNEKYVEYESANSSVMIMDSALFPTVEFEKEEVTYEKINGIIKIKDDYGTINLNENLSIVYTNSVGETNSFTSLGSLTIPFDRNNLRANETYIISVYGQVDLQDGNGPIDDCYIGSFTVKTELPNNLVARLSQNTSINTSAFVVNFQLENSSGVTRKLEAQTLTGMTLSIYSGATATGVAKKTINLVDTNVAEYESTLMEEYYDNYAIITPATFGLKNSDFNDKTYTLVVSGGYDYTKYQNELPILNNQVVITTSGTLPDLPQDVNDALQVEVIRNRDAESFNKNLNVETIVGYKVTPYFNNSSGYVKTITYYLCNANGKVLSSKKLDVGDSSTLLTVIFDVKNGTYDTEDDSILDYMVRGNSYYFTYTMEMDLDKDGIAETQYPYEVSGIVPTLRSKEVSPSKQNPSILLYPANSTENYITYKYKITDVDNALIRDIDLDDGSENVLKIYMQNANRTISKQIVINEPSDDQFNYINFDGVAVGNLKLSVYQKLQKKSKIAERNLVDQYFEGYVSVSEIKYNITTYANSLDIELIGPEDLMDRVASVDVKFQQESGEVTTIENLIISNNIITIPYNTIAELCGQQLTVGVDLWFDDGLFGYEMNSQYYTFQNQKSTSKDSLYYRVTKTSVTTKNDALGLKYNMSRKDNILELTNVVLNSQANWKLTLTENGYLHNYDIILPKEVIKSSIDCIEDSIIKFDKVLPSISLQHTDAGEIYFDSDLVSTTFIPSLSDVEVSGLTDDTDIYIEVYNTDDDGSNANYLKTITRKVSDFGKKVKITDLNPKEYYFIKFYYEDETFGKVYLYDIDYNIQGMQYAFGTLTNVEISDISVEYIAEDYLRKYLSIEYSLNTVLGLDKINYELQKYNEVTGIYETLLSNEDIGTSTTIKKDMTLKISTIPGSSIVFGEKYKLIISPIKVIDSGEVDVGIKEYQFELEELENPYIVARGDRDIEKSTISFWITLYDDDCVLVNNEYSVVIYDNNGNDITPDKYKNSTFSKNLQKRVFTIDVDDARLSYRIEVNALADKANSGTNFKTVTKTYRLKDISNANISFGEVSAQPNLEQYNRVDLIFSDSYNLRNLETLKYTVYDIEGNSESGTIPFTATVVDINGSIYYLITLPTKITVNGTYYIQISGIVDDKLEDTRTIEYVFMD